MEKWQKAKDEKAKVEANQIKEDDWECQKCDHVNKMDKKDLNSAYCKKSKAKNEWIEYMIKLANDNESAKQAEIEMDYYKKNKDLDHSQGKPAVQQDQMT